MAGFSQIRSVDGAAHTREWDSVPFTAPADGNWIIVPGYVGEHFQKHFPPREGGVHQIEVQPYTGAMAASAPQVQVRACPWPGCDFKSNDDPAMRSHVLEHAKADADGPPVPKPGEESFPCQELGCDYVGPTAQALRGHMMGRHR